jgi:hypothetical protein
MSRPRRSGSQTPRRPCAETGVVYRFRPILIHNTGLGGTVGQLVASMPLCGCFVRVSRGIGGSGRRAVDTPATTSQLHQVVPQRVCAQWPRTQRFPPGSGSLAVVRQEGSRRRALRRSSARGALDSSRHSSGVGAHMDTSAGRNRCTQRPSGRRRGSPSGRRRLHHRNQDGLRPRS